MGRSAAGQGDRHVYVYVSALVISLSCNSVRSVAMRVPDMSCVLFWFSSWFLLGTTIPVYLLTVTQIQPFRNASHLDQNTQPSRVAKLSSHDDGRDAHAQSHIHSANRKRSLTSCRFSSSPRPPAQAQPLSSCAPCRPCHRGASARRPLFPPSRLVCARRLVRAFP